MILLQPKTNRYDDYIKYASDNGFGFEIISFMFPAVLDDNATVKKLIKFFNGSPVVSLHGPFVDINYSGGDKRVFDVSKYRIEQCAECAAMLGAEKMVLHSCFFPLMSKNDPLYKLWSEESAHLFKSVTERYNITICVENMLDRDPDIISGMMAQCASNERVKVCIDTGHARLSPAPINVWLDSLGKYAVHYHINDNMGYYDDHLAVGDGVVDWDTFFGNLPDGGDFVIEVPDLERVERSVAFLKAAGQFDRLVGKTAGV